MFERLNEQTKQILLRLIAGQRTKIGDTDVEALEESTQLALQVIAENLNAFDKEKGEALANLFLSLLSSSTKYQIEELEEKEGDVPFIVKTLDGLAELNVAGWG